MGAGGPPPSYLVLLYTVTAGQNAENLGSDEQQVVVFVYVLYDVCNNKVVTLQHHYVRPVLNDLSECILTEECQAQTSLPEHLIRNAQPIEHVLEEFDRFIEQKDLHPEHGSRPFCLVTDGQLHLRQVIHPEAVRKNMLLAPYLHKFFDLRKEFRKFYKTHQMNCLNDMLEHLGLEGDQTIEYGVRQTQEMASIIQRLISDGHLFRDPEVVKDKLEAGICCKSDFVDDETVIRARGLPWQSSDQDIARFFKGLNVAKGGVALCLSQQGRRNGEALIRFESKDHRDLALRKHKHHLGQRYIEVYKATGKDFVNVAGGNSTEAQVFLSRHNGHGGQVIIRMRGLPYSCTAEQVLEFFRSGDTPVETLDGEDGILFVHQADGRATGDAFVLFASEEDAGIALSKHRENIGSRYIELFKSTTAEVQQVLNRSLDPRNPAEAEPQLPLFPQAPLIFPQQLITSGTQRDCIRLRGLPYESTVTDILTFLGEHARNIVFQGVHMVYNSQGTPSGEAFIQMDSAPSAEIAALSKHKKFMFIGNKKRYIEVLQCSGEDMNLVLTNGLNGLPPLPMNPMAQLNGLAALPPLNGLSPMSPINGMPLPIPTSTTAYPSPLSTPQILPKPLVSPGGTMLPPTPGAYSLYPYGAGAALSAAAAGTMVTGSTQAITHPSILSAQTATPQIPQVTQALTTPGMTYLPGIPPRASPYGHQPLLYWYPSPPVSPQSAYYVHACPTTVVMKGLPFTTSSPEILGFFEGIYEMQPDVQIQRGPDGRPNGEAYVTFGSRTEAERAITERNRKVMGNRYIELHMA